MAKQTQIAGTISKEDAKLEALAAEYAQARDERMEIQKTEVELKGKVIAMMKERGTYEEKTKTYWYVRGEYKVKVKESIDDKLKVVIGGDEVAEEE